MGYIREFDSEKRIFQGRLVVSGNDGHFGNRFYKDHYNSDLSLGSLRHKFESEARVTYTCTISHWCGGPSFVLPAEIVTIDGMNLAD
ncbi:MAG TPA: hypothetical protein PLN86_11800 [Candidatus Hydrogenedentes bacterium]|nr:hypothetical protein [Candidatus Hydrogenedentota bacterium]